MCVCVWLLIRRLVNSSLTCLYAGIAVTPNIANALLMSKCFCFVWTLGAEETRGFGSLLNLLYGEAVIFLHVGERTSVCWLNETEKQ